MPALSALWRYGSAQAFPSRGSVDARPTTPNGEEWEPFLDSFTKKGGLFAKYDK